MRTPKPIDPNAFAYSPADAARFCGLGLTRIKALLRDGTIPHRKDGRRRDENYWPPTKTLDCQSQWHLRGKRSNVAEEETKSG